MWQLSWVWIGRLHPFPGITPPVQAPSFPINHRAIFSSARASRGHLTVTLVGQGITLRCSRNDHLFPTALSRKLTALLPASWKQKQAPGLSDEFAWQNQLQHGGNFPSQLPLQQKKTTQGPKEVKCADTVHRSLENIKVRGRLLTYIFIHLAVIKSLKLLLQKQLHINCCFMIKRC